MPKGQKICPSCHEPNGCRSHVCFNCDFVFAAGRRVEEKEVNCNGFKTFGNLASPAIPQTKRPQSNMDVFESMSQLVGLVASKFANGLFLCGPPGTGKTHTVLRTLGKHKMRENVDYFKISGHASPLGLYNSLYERQDKLIVFDDCDAVLKNLTGINILKAVLDTNPRRQVCWASTSAKAAIDQFDFTGQVIFISNLNPREISDINLQAMISRVLCVVVGKTRDEILERTIQHIPIIMKDFDKDIHAEVEEWLIEHQEHVDVSFRMPVKLNGLIKYAPNNWRDLAFALE